MKKDDTSQDPFEDVITELGKQEAEQNAKSLANLADALAQEIARRACRLLNQSRASHELRIAAERTLLDWFTGKFTPGGPTDPPGGAPTQPEKTGGPKSGE